MTRIGVEVTPAAKLDSGDAWSLASLGYGREVRARNLAAGAGDVTAIKRLPANQDDGNA